MQEAVQAAHGRQRQQRTRARAVSMECAAANGMQTPAKHVTRSSSSAAATALAAGAALCSAHLEGDGRRRASAPRTAPRAWSASCTVSGSRTHGSGLHRPASACSPRRSRRRCRRSAMQSGRRGECCRQAVRRRRRRQAAGDGGWLQGSGCALFTPQGRVLVLQGTRRGRKRAARGRPVLGSGPGASSGRSACPHTCTGPVGAGAPNPGACIVRWAHSSRGKCTGRGNWLLLSSSDVGKPSVKSCEVRSSDQDAPGERHLAWRVPGALLALLHAFPIVQSIEQHGIQRHARSRLTRAHSKQVLSPGNAARPCSPVLAQQPGRSLPEHRTSAPVDVWAAAAACRRAPALAPGAAR